MSKDKRQERKQETTQESERTEMAAQSEAKPEPVEPPPRYQRPTDEQVTQVALRLCMAFENANQSTVAMKPVTRAIEQMAGEVLKMGKECDWRYMRDLLARLIAVCESFMHRHQQHAATLEHLLAAKDTLDAACKVQP